MQGLAPRAVEAITLPAWHARDGSGPDPAALEAAGVSCLTEWQPRDARRGHRHRLKTVVNTPGRQRLAVSGVRAQGAHDLVGLPVRPTSHARMRTPSAPSGLGDDRAQARARTGVAVGG